MLLKVCLIFEKPTAFIVKTIIIANGGIQQTMCDSMEILGNLIPYMFPMTYIP